MLILACTWDKIIIIKFFVVLRFELSVYTLSHSTSPFLWWVFWDKVLRAICLGWLWTVILMISVSWVTRITGMSHQHLAYNKVLTISCICRVLYWKWKLVVLLHFGPNIKSKTWKSDHHKSGTVCFWITCFPCYFLLLDITYFVAGTI
jgi:hypothetical protein